MIVKIKKLFKYLILVPAVYLATDTLPVRSEVSQNIAVSAGYKIYFGSQINADTIKISCDGPIIVYENEKLVSYKIEPYKSTCRTSKTEISKQDSITCYVDEIDQSFKFLLKDKLHTQPDEYPLPQKMLMISDIEGNFKGLKSILEGNNIIDEQLNWTFGNNHLVIVGDLFDRALNVTECLWLIYKLENEAEKQGGKVHFIIGNHEMMNLKGQFKYVRDKYLQNADTLKLEYAKWYSPNTELGKWLRTKNGIEKIGDLLFVHAGISKDFPKDKYTLTDINNNMRSVIDTQFEKGKQSNDIFIGRQSPIWYRGIANGEETQDDIDKTLSSFKSSKMIIGHTISEQMKYLYNQKVIAIDLDHQDNSEKGIMYALWFENGKFTVTNQNGVKTLLK